MGKYGKVKTELSQSNKFKYYTIADARDLNGDRLPYSVSLVSECVVFYRRRMKPLKAVYLRKKLFKEFTDWTKLFLNEKNAEASVKLLTFDGVEIYEASNLAINDISWEFYPQQPVAQA